MCSCANASPRFKNGAVAAAHTRRQPHRLLALPFLLATTPLLAHKSIQAQNRLQMPFMARYDPFSPQFDHPLLNSSPDYGSRNGTFRTRPIGDFGNQLTFRERNKRLREFDDEKNQLIEVCCVTDCRLMTVLDELTRRQELLFHLESTENRLKQLQLDHTRESQYSRDGQLRENTLQDQLRRVKGAMVGSFLPALAPC